MRDRFRVFGLLGQHLQELGIQPTEVLRQAGLPVNLFEQSPIWLTTHELFALYAAVEQVSGRSDIGLQLGSRPRTERYSPLAIAALYSRTFEEALRRISRYKRTVGPEEIRLTQHGEEFIVQFVWLLAEDQEPPTLADVCFASILTVGAHGTGRRIRPLRVELRRPDNFGTAFREFFDCPVWFGQTKNRLVLRTADMAELFATHNPDLLELVCPHLEAELAQQLSQSSVREQVKGILKKLLAGQHPRLEDVASELRLSPRSLQPHLSLEQVTFHSVMDEARRELAEHYLVHSSLELNETAYLLGYENPTSFIRAFNRWEGTSPGEWRSSHKQRALSSAAV